jgi:hypothetical protein
MFNKCGADDEMRTDRGTETLEGNLPQCNFFHHKTHMT